MKRSELASKNAEKFRDFQTRRLQMFTFPKDLGVDKKIRAI